HMVGVNGEDGSGEEVLVEIHVVPRLYGEGYGFGAECGNLAQVGGAGIEQHSAEAVAEPVQHADVAGSTCEVKAAPQRLLCLDHLAASVKCGRFCGQGQALVLRRKRLDDECGIGTSKRVCSIARVDVGERKRDERPTVLLAG